MDTVAFWATVSLFFQVTIFGLLVGGYVLKKQQKFWLHGVFMLVAVVLHFGSIFAIMLPSFVFGVLPYMMSAPFDLIMLVSAVHGALGVIAPILAVWLIASWRLRKATTHCMRKKQWM
ncbi:MAG: hypothetical protein ACQXXJ_04840, partial [Candidatus Bathyarchaeia archaeon]